MGDPFWKKGSPTPPSKTFETGRKGLVIAQFIFLSRSLNVLEMARENFSKKSFPNAMLVEGFSEKNVIFYKKFSKNSFIL